MKLAEGERLTLARFRAALERIGDPKQTEGISEVYSYYSSTELLRLLCEPWFTEDEYETPEVFAHELERMTLHELRRHASHALHLIAYLERCEARVEKSTATTGSKRAGQCSSPTDTAA